MKRVALGILAMAVLGAGGGSCAAPYPYPTTLASNLDNPWGLAVDSANVYWVNSGDCVTASGSVMMCAIGGCGDKPTTLASGLVCPWALAVDATTVYWTSLGDTNDQPLNGPGAAIGSVMTCPIAGCNNAPTTLVSGIDSPQTLAVDATNVYWTDPVAQTVDKCAIGGCGNTPTVLASGVGDVLGLAVDATSVYWAQGSVMQVPIAGGSPTTLACTDSTDVAVDSANVYCLDSDNPGGMSEAPKAAGSAVTSLWTSSGGVSPVALAVDGTSVYWTSSDNEVRRVPIGGGSVTVVASGPGGAGQIVVDSANVYWTTETAVVKISK